MNKIFVFLRLPLALMLMFVGLALWFSQMQERDPISMGLRCKLGFHDWQPKWNGTSFQKVKCSRCHKTAILEPDI